MVMMVVQDGLMLVQAWNRVFHNIRDFLRWYVTPTLPARRRVGRRDVVERPPEHPGHVVQRLAELDAEGARRGGRPEGGQAPLRSLEDRPCAGVGGVGQGLKELGVDGQL